MKNELYDLLKQVPETCIWYVSDYIQKNCDSADLEHDDESDIVNTNPCTLTDNCPTCRSHSKKSLEVSPKCDTSYGGLKKGFLFSAQKQERKHDIVVDGAKSQMNIKDSYNERFIPVDNWTKELIDEFVNMIFGENYGSDNANTADINKICSALNKFCEAYSQFVHVEDAHERIVNINALIESIAVNTAPLISVSTHSRAGIPTNREPRLFDIMYMSTDMLQETMLRFIDYAEEDGCIELVARKVLSDRPTVIFALYFDKLFKNIDIYNDAPTDPSVLKGQQMIFKRMENHGFRNTLEWAVKKIEKFINFAKLRSPRLSSFSSLTQCKKQELRTVIQAILKHREQHCSSATERIISVNPIFRPLCSVLDFNKFDVQQP